jgi:TRAP-type C4-dicarboxylate transport system substrate-binding protein
MVVEAHDIGFIEERGGEIMSTSLRRLAAAAVTVALACATGSVAAETTLRLSTLFKPGSAGAEAAEEYARRVEERTDGRVHIDVYPASQLGDWVEVHTQLMQGAVDMALQPLSASFDKRLAIAWFPYMTPTYDAAEQAYSQGGFVFEIVDDVIAEQNLKLLGVYGAGMGGAGFATAVQNPADPDAEHDIKIRVWPGGTTHRVLMDRLGYSVATVPWAELYTAMQTGVVDGQIGGTAEMTLANFRDITEMWIQYNDHFEPGWFVINRARFQSLPEADRQVLLEVAQEMTEARFQELRKADQRYLTEMREAGIEVVTFSDDELERFATVARQDVWPEIGDQLGEEVMVRLREAVGLD